MTTVKEEKADYDEYTPNPVLAEIEAETAGENDTKNKTRRYWSPKEEERFFEIWGRENWRLTKHGKNTIFFAKWAEEMKERFNIDVKPEEVQAKVNQTRAKFRQVKKQLDIDKTGARWKKFDIIDKILKNQYRPEDAEPIPPEALENNRDISPERLTISKSLALASLNNTPNSTQDGNSQAPVTDGKSTTASNEQLINTGQANPKDVTLPEHDLSTGLMYADAVEIKKEFVNENNTEDMQNEYADFAQFQEQNSVAVPAPEGVSADMNVTRADDEEPPQLHQLQTPQQQQQLLQQQASAVNDHSTNSIYANSVNHTGADIQNRSLLINSQQQPNQVYTNSNNQHVTNSNGNNFTNMQPPRVSAVQPRKRRSSGANCITTVAGQSLPADSLEAIYVEEMRKKNLILAEQKYISRKRMLLEERKVTLMEQFFPKCLELQEKILEKLNNT